MLEDPVPALKRQLADAILAIAAQTNMHVAARKLGIDPSRMSDLRRGRIARFSVERLIRLLAAVDRRVELTVVVVGLTRVRWYDMSFGRKQTLPKSGNDG